MRNYYLLTTANFYLHISSGSEKYINSQFLWKTPFHISEKETIYVFIFIYSPLQIVALIQYHPVDENLFKENIVNSVPRFQQNSYLFFCANEKLFMKFPKKLDIQSNEKRNNQICIIQN